MVHLTLEDTEAHYLEAIQVVLHWWHPAAPPHRLHRPLHLLSAVGGCRRHVWWQ